MIDDSPNANPELTTGSFMKNPPGRFLTRSTIAVMLLALACFCTTGVCFDGDLQNPPSQGGPPAEVCTPCVDFNLLNTRVRDGDISRTKAKEELLLLLPAIKDYYYRNGGRDYSRSDWVFPLKGYTSRAIAGGKHHGYEPGGYDWFDGNRHKGHPSLDIFIHDRDRDDRDDQTGRHVPVLSLTGGVVVALEKSWNPGSRLRGGKYLWIYDPASQALVYYAHNRELTVGLGAIVRPGDPIALVGRTGLNAYRKRSPTHLHITYLNVRNGNPAPENLFPSLLKSRTIE